MKKEGEVEGEREVQRRRREDLGVLGLTTRALVAAAIGGTSRGKDSRSLLKRAEGAVGEVAAKVAERGARRVGLVVGAAGGGDGSPALGGLLGATEGSA